MDEPDPELVAVMTAATESYPVVVEAEPELRTSPQEILALRAAARHLADEPDREVDETGKPLIGRPDLSVGRHAANTIAEARTDEWTRPENLEQDGPTLDDVPGPPLFDEDSWDVEPDDQPIDAYHGRRRAQATARRLWLAIGLAVVCLAAAIGIPMMLSSNNGPPLVAPTTTTQSLSGDEPPATAPLVLATPAATPTPTRTPRPSRSTPKATTPAATTTAPPTTPPFAPATYQAEDGQRTGSAVSSGPPNCKPTGPPVVSRIGNWSDPAGPGTLTLTVNVPTAGTYQMVITYVQTSDTTRVAQISVNGGTSINESFTRTDLASSPGGSDCVDPHPAIAVTLKQGTNTIRFANPTGRAPTIDKIVLSRP
jgi:hypothetical protein